ncbi:hypothetical protein E5N72_18275 [Pseudoalteromonas sp. MEBiC 03607]|uniref:hypothetical protein n=1 Tax=Pseudoalteromonas sp. MEBiC 03607 TaxID=2563601 RepID=UPI001093A208|nr:hypothetical protein [Pseudoalteromonas sp. MEBiC 03607]TGV17176.1 hypothetical protein E5N72_18275 [Pseudoalteromonas sp. MEBiC 03607]
MEKQELIEVNNEIERINDRVANIERIASTIEDLAEKGVEAFVKHMDHKEETQQKELELDNAKHQREVDLENIIHKRSVIIVGATVLGVFALVFTAMLLSEKELVKTILTSSLAVGAGFGIKSALNKPKGSKQTI